MNHFFEIITSLQYSLKAAIAQAEAFKSGKKSLDMQKAHEEEIRKLSMRIGQLEKRALHGDGRLDKAEEKITLQRRQIYTLETELEEEKGKTCSIRRRMNTNTYRPAIIIKKDITCICGWRNLYLSFLLFGRLPSISFPPI